MWYYYITDVVTRTSKPRGNTDVVTQTSELHGNTAVVTRTSEPRGNTDVVTRTSAPRGNTCWVDRMSENFMLHLRPSFLPFHIIKQMKIGGNLKIRFSPNEAYFQVNIILDFWLYASAHVQGKK